MFIKEETIQVQLPIKEKLFQLDMEGPTEDMNGNVSYPSNDEEGELSNARENMGVAAFIIRSLALWGRSIIYHFQGGRDRDPHQIWEPESQFADLKKQTEDFVATLPESLRFTQENLNAHETEGLANQFIFLHITSQQNILLLNQNAVQGPRSGRPRIDPPRDFVIQASEMAFDAAKRISEFLRAADLYPVTAPFTGYCAFLSSTVQMTAAFSKDEAIASLAKENLATNVRYLTKMKRYWGTFHWTSEQLKKQFRACADAAKRGNYTCGLNTITQYGDWFDRYPHGVSQSDFEDPAVAIKKEKGDDAVLEHKSDLHTVEQFFHTITPAQPTDAAKNKRKKKAAPAAVSALPSNQPTSQPPPQSAPSPQQQQQQQHSPSVNLPPQSLQISDHAISQAQTHNQAYPHHFPSFLAIQQPPLYGQDLLFPSHQLGIMPQLDRQLVYGAYAGMGPHDINMSGLHAGATGAVESMSWDATSGPGAGLDGLAAMQAPWTAEPTSAWFMPFNMQPPDVGGEQEIFESLGLGTAVELGAGSYGMEMGMGPGQGMGGHDGGVMGGGEGGN